MRLQKTEWRTAMQNSLFSIRHSGITIPMGLGIFTAALLDWATDALAALRERHLVPLSKDILTGF